MVAHSGILVRREPDAFSDSTIEPYSISKPVAADPELTALVSDKSISAATIMGHNRGPTCTFGIVKAHLVAGLCCVLPLQYTEKLKALITEQVGRDVVQGINVTADSFYSSQGTSITPAAPCADTLWLSVDGCQSD